MHSGVEVPRAMKVKLGLNGLKPAISGEEGALTQKPAQTAEPLLSVTDRAVPNPQSLSGLAHLPPSAR